MKIQSVIVRCEVVCVNNKYWVVRWKYSGRKISHEFVWRFTYTWNLDAIIKRRRRKKRTNTPRGWGGTDVVVDNSDNCNIILEVVTAVRTRFLLLPVPRKAQQHQSTRGWTIFGQGDTLETYVRPKTYWHAQFARTRWVGVYEWSIFTSIYCGLYTLYRYNNNNNKKRLRPNRFANTCCTRPPRYNIEYISMRVRVSMWPGMTGRRMRCVS